MQRSEEKGHKLRLSIDLRSLKDHQFTAQLYLKYPSHPPLNISHFKSAPAMPISNPKVEITLNNCFSFCHFEADGDDLQSKLDHLLKIELWHNDRLRNDVKLGVASISLLTLLDHPLRKLNESYARVFDAYVPVDQLDANDKPVKTIGALRVLIYLEDQGPIGMLQEKEADINHLLEESHSVDGPKLPSKNDDRLKLELGELEYKVVWELQTWKKAEEAKTRIILKQKQIDFWSNLSEQQRKIELEKEKQFKKMEATINNLEAKLKGKMGQLMKREQKIVVFQQELQTKIAQASRECLSKDENIERIKTRGKEQKAQIVKQKAAVELQLAKARAENARLKVQIEEMRRMEDKSAMGVLKNELHGRLLQIKQISKELQKCNQIREEYKVYYNKMKDEVICLRAKVSEREDSLREMKYERDIALNNFKNMEQQLHYERSLGRQAGPVKQEVEGDGYFGLNQRDRMIRARQELLEQGLYSPQDELIREYDRNIADIG